MELDLNCDLGEGAGDESAIIPLITSANVCCGFHAGGPDVTLATLRDCQAAGVVVGAHPGHPDREQFGRREIPITPAQVVSLVTQQVDALLDLARRVPVAVRYIKPHGGLYHQVCREEPLADALIEVAVSLGLAVMGLPGSALEHRARERCRFIAEGFADRRYRSDGTLVPRDQPGAFVDDPREAVAQARDLHAHSGIRSLCVHGDNPKALDFVRALRKTLTQDGFTLRPFA